MSRVMRKPVFGVSGHIRHKPGCIATEDGQRLGFRVIALRITEAKQRLSLFSHMQKAGFLMQGSNINK